MVQTPITSRSIKSHSTQPADWIRDVNRRKYIEKIQDALGNRKLIWVGTRGHDAIGLMDIPQFSEAYGIIAPVGALSLQVDLTLEQLTKRRVDLDTYSIDDDRSFEAKDFRRRLLTSLTEPSYVVAYRSLGLLSSICYPRSEFVTYLGMFHERQSTFEHKPWVESELRNAGVSIIPWRYFADEDRRRLQEELLANEVLVLRSNRSDGGAGLGMIEAEDEIPSRLSRNTDGFLAAAPLLDPHIPLNANACVFRDGSVTLHPASIQLIGIQQCTSRRFGYCGNDFGAVKELGNTILNDLASLIEQTGRWMHSEGYVGAFGVDALVHQGRVLLTEINPRFQGSSALCARIDRHAGRPDLFVCHLAAHLGLSSPRTPSLSDILKSQPNWAQIVMHNRLTKSVRFAKSAADLPNLEYHIVPDNDIEILPDAIMCRLGVAQRVSRDGRTLEPAVVSALKAYTQGTPIPVREPRSNSLCQRM